MREVFLAFLLVIAVILVAGYVICAVRELRSGEGGGCLSGGLVMVLGWSADDRGRNPPGRRARGRGGHVRATGRLTGDPVHESQLVPDGEVPAGRDCGGDMLAALQMAGGHELFRAGLVSYSLNVRTTESLFPSRERSMK